MSRLLIVEDDHALRRTLAISLGARHYSVYEAGTGARALELLDAVSPDLLILDLGLPDMDGLSLIDRVRATSRVPIIVLSARNLQSQKVDALEAGADDYPIMARVKVPAASIDLPIYHGTTDDVIAKGVGHLYGTSLPVGGVDTHAVLTSHTGMASATLFDHLVDVKEGDLMFVEVLGETLAYRVDQIKVILPNEISDLTKVEGHDYLTLFTCTPYAVNTHRLLVRGERVPYTPQVAEVAAHAEQASAFKIEPWMWWLLAGAAAGLVALLVIAWRERQLRHPRQQRWPHQPGPPAARVLAEPPVRGGRRHRPRRTA